MPPLVLNHSSRPVVEVPLIRSCFRENCVHWTDTQGQRIEAHGAGLLQSPLDHRWYWYGESEKYANLWGSWPLNESARHERRAAVRQAAPGVNLYSAGSLEGPWRFEGRVLSQWMIRARLGQNSGPWIVERPKVIFCARTSQFVMWFHLDDSEYHFRRVGVATSSGPAGPFRFVHALQPDGLPSLDMSLFHDPGDGVGYFVRSVNNSYMGISRLSADMLNTTGIISTYSVLEGMAIFRLANGTYYMITSHLTGWDPNPLVLLRAAGSTLDNPLWVNMGNPTGHQTSFNSQPTFVVECRDVSGDAFFVYLADNWIHAGPRGLKDAGYIWLPFSFGDQSVSLPKKWGWSMRNPFANNAPSHGRTQGGGARNRSMRHVNTAGLAAGGVRVTEPSNSHGDSCV